MVLPHEKSNSHGQWGLRAITPCPLYKLTRPKLRVGAKENKPKRVCSAHTVDLTLCIFPLSYTTYQFGNRDVLGTVDRLFAGRFEFFNPLKIYFDKIEF